MSYTNWLRAQIAHLEEEIRQTPVFDTNAPATAAELRELRTKAVLRTYLKQQLLRRKTASAVAAQVPQHDDELDTQELIIVRGA